MTHFVEHTKTSLRTTSLPIDTNNICVYIKPKLYSILGTLPPFGDLCAEYIITVGIA